MSNPFASLNFHPVIHLPNEYDVYDFTEGYDPDRPRREYGIGRYDEDRKGMYTESMFTENQRTIHMGIDIAAPPKTPIYAVYDGMIAFMGNNDQPQDYGPTIITAHDIHGRTLYILHGHLSLSSLSDKSIGQAFTKGSCIGWVGDQYENGGWNPHLHFQLSWLKPTTYDLQGVVSPAQREWARQSFPDPRYILGPIYTDEV